MTKRVKRTIQRNTEIDNISLENAFIDFIREKKINNLSEYSIIAYENCYKKLLSFIGENLLCKDITEKVIQDWTFEMLENEDIKHITINYYLRNSKVFLNWCMDRGYIEDFKIKLLKGQEETIKVFTDEEVKLLLEKPKDINNFVENRTYTIVNWVLGTGNRSQTLRFLKISDIDFTHKNIIITQQKNKKVHTIPLSRTLEIVISEYIQTWLSESKPDDYLFPNVGNEQLSRNALRLSFERYCKSRGVNRVKNIHSLRHYFSKLWCLSSNGDVFRLQKILGHSKLEMTRKYVNLFSADLHKDFEKYNPLDNIKKGMSRKQVITRN